MQNDGPKNEIESVTNDLKFSMAEYHSGLFLTTPHSQNDNEHFSVHFQGSIRSIKFALVFSLQSYHSWFDDFWLL